MVKHCYLLDQPSDKDIIIFRYLGWGSLKELLL